MTDFPPPEQLHYYTPYYPPPRRPVSVSVIAWLIIAFCGLGIFGGFFIIIQREYLSAFQPADPLSQAMYAPGLIRTYTIVSQIIAFVINLILLITAIGSLRLKPWARILMIRMMYFQLFMLVIGSVFSITVLRPAMAKIFQQNANTAMMASLFYVSQFIGFALGLAYPLVILYFFTRPKVKSAFEETPPPITPPMPLPPSSFTPQP